MSSGWIVALELFVVLGCLIGWALWDLRAMRRPDKRQKKDDSSAR